MYNPTDQVILSEILEELAKKISKDQDSVPMEFVTRLSANFSTIRELFNSLYGNHERSEKHFKRLIQALFKNYIKRSEELRHLDQQREADPQWLLNQKWVGTSLYVEHFSGNLKKFLKRVPYLQELGVNLVHLMPLLKTPIDNSDGGYAVSDYRQVNPKLGKMADLRGVAKELRSRDMLLTLDLVLNHTANEHKWATLAQAGDRKFQQYYYMFPDRTEPDKFETHMPEVFPNSAPGNFTYVQSIDKWVMTVFHNYQWDLNYRNPRVFMEMLDNLLYLANLGTDIIRLDAPAYLWKEIGTSGQNLPQTHSILKLMKRCTEVTAPGVKFIAEAIVAPSEIIKYFGDEEELECDIAYHANLMALFWDALATTKTALMQRSLNKLKAKPLGTTWITYARGHDDIGLGIDNEDIMRVGFDPNLHRRFLLDYYSGKFKGSPAKGALFMPNQLNGDARISGCLASLAGLELALELGDEEKIDLAIKKILLAHALILSFGGLPMIFSGDEIGQLNDYSYLDQDKKDYDNRWMHRPRMNWTAVEKKDDPDSVTCQIFQGLARLIEIRKNTPEFADRNNFKLIHCENQHLLAYLRYQKSGIPGENSSTLVLMSFHPSVQYLSKAILLHQGFNLTGKVVDKITGAPPRYVKNLIEMGPYQVYFLSENT